MANLGGVKVAGMREGGLERRIATILGVSLQQAAE